MALPITIPYTFANATSSIPLSNLDTDFTTVANAINGIGNGTNALSNVTISGGSITGDVSVSGNLTFTGGLVPASSFKRNRIINGNMLIDQRNAGASVTVVGGGSFYYACDRFFLQSFGASSTAQRTAGSGSSQYQLQFNGASGVTSQVVTQRIESANCFDLASQTATLSFSTSNSLLTTLNYSVFVPTGGTDTWTSQSTVLSGSITINSTMTRYAIQLALPISVQSGMAVALTVGSQISGTWVLQNIQLEVGTIATPYERQIYSDQLAQCQRYYYKLKAATAYTSGGVGRAYSTTNCQAFVALPVSMRAAPTGSYSALADWNDSGGGTPSAMDPINQYSADYRWMTINLTGTYASGQAIALNANNTTNAFIAWSAEL